MDENRPVQYDVKARNIIPSALTLDELIEVIPYQIKQIKCSM